MTGRRRSFYAAGQPKLSGMQYVPAILKVPEGGRSNGAFKLKIRMKYCDHTFTVCHTRKCVASWQNDYVLVFSLTEGGRGLWRATHPGEDMPTS